MIYKIPIDIFIKILDTLGALTLFLFDAVIATKNVRHLLKQNFQSSFRHRGAIDLRHFAHRDFYRSCARTASFLRHEHV